ncbi:MAG TPA: thiosulfohydrolase SoxB, partial [Gammaproteobacteria bacterium]|nr:thiosulfohydrolase SoxB [Gammaproteobacteria bacterium]
SNMELDGKPIEPDKEYSVAGWANVAQPISGRNVWDVVAEYLRAQDTVKIKELNEPRLKNVADNPGYEKL